MDEGEEGLAHHSPVDHQEARQGGTKAHCPSVRDGDLVRMLIGDEYMCKLEDELAPILTVKISAYVDGVEMDKEFYKLALEHSFEQKGIVGEWQFTGYFNNCQGNVVGVACDEKFLRTWRPRPACKLVLPCWERSASTNKEQRRRQS